MFKKGTIIVYPKYGSGKIASITQENIDNQIRNYYEVNFFHSQISILVPVDNAVELGLKENYNPTELKKALKNLGKKVNITEGMITNLEIITKEKLKSGQLEDAIDLVNIINAHSKKKEKINKKISFTESKNLESALKFLSSVTETVLGKKAVEKYDLIVE